MPEGFEFGEIQLVMSVDDTAFEQGLREGEAAAKAAASRMQGHLSKLEGGMLPAVRSTEKLSKATSVLSASAAVTGNAMLGTAAATGTLATALSALEVSLVAVKAAFFAIPLVGWAAAAATAIIALRGPITRGITATLEWAGAWEDMGDRLKVATERLDELKKKLGEQQTTQEKNIQTAKDALALAKLENEVARGRLTPMQFETRKAEIEGMGGRSSEVASLRIEKQRAEAMKAAFEAAKKRREQNERDAYIARLTLEAEKQKTQEAKRQAALAMRMRESQRVTGGEVRTRQEAGTYLSEQFGSFLRADRSRNMILEHTISQLRRGIISSQFAVSILNRFGVSSPTSARSTAATAIAARQFTNLGAAASQLGAVQSKKVEDNTRLTAVNTKRTADLTQRLYDEIRQGAAP